MRWTEQRNFEAVLQAISTGQLAVDALITERVPLAEFNQVYGSIGSSRSIASLLIYPASAERSTQVVATARTFAAGAPLAGIIGAGNFTKMTMLPAMKQAGAEVKYIASAGGVSGTFLAKKWNIANSTTRFEDLLEDAAVRLVLITTRHDKHAPMVVQALEAGKHVFVEKPLALSLEELAQIEAAYQKAGNLTVTVGFNRRFSPHAVAIKTALGADPGPINLICTMNAGAIPASVWVHDLQTGGGRIVGEACHFIDLAAYLTGSHVTRVVMSALGQSPQANTDNAIITLHFANGSQCVINYFANGNKAYSKERVEVYSQGRTLISDNFRTTTGFGFKSFSKLKTSLDKGHRTQFNALFQQLRQGGPALIPFESLANTTRASFAALLSLQEGRWVEV